MYLWGRFSCCLMNRDLQLVPEYSYECDRYRGSRSHSLCPGNVNHVSIPVPINILSSKDITCLCLIRDFVFKFKGLICSQFDIVCFYHYRSSEIGFGSSAISPEPSLGERCNKRGVLKLTRPGRGARAMGGWFFEETLRRRVRLAVFFAPSVAKCLSARVFDLVARSCFKISSLIALISYQIIDIAYLCLIRFFHIVLKCLDDSRLSMELFFDFGSFAI